VPGKQQGRHGSLAELNSQDSSRGKPNHVTPLLRAHAAILGYFQGCIVCSFVTQTLEAVWPGSPRGPGPRPCWGALVATHAAALQHHMACHIPPPGAPPNHAGGKKCSIHHDLVGSLAGYGNQQAVIHTTTTPNRSHLPGYVPQRPVAGIVTGLGHLGTFLKVRRPCAHLHMPNYTRAYLYTALLATPAAPTMAMHTACTHAL
jgi:hypothetical protein